MQTVDIEWLVPDGRGAGKGATGVIRVRGAVPGDRIAFRTLTERGRTIEGELTEILTPSANRQTPSCPWQAECGGCDLAHYTAPARAAALTKMVSHALAWDQPIELVASPRQTGHRARIKLAVDNGRIGYRAHRSHTLVEPGTCAIARPEVQVALHALRAAVSGDPLLDIESVELRSDGSRAVVAIEGPRHCPEPLKGRLEALGDVAWNGRRLHGEPTLSVPVGAHTLRISPRAFYQVNLEANALLVAHVVQQAVQRSPERVLDLYAGAGNLTLPLAAQTGVPVHAVELEGQSLADLRHNLATEDLPITVQGGKVERFDPSTQPFDLVVLDPPRSGAKGVLPRLLRNRPRTAVYVSCDIRSAARDLRGIAEQGYRLADVRCFDLFPDTHHIETVLVLERT
jgi:23S rRNA (uracil1939-C5)-methyltransferase